MATYREPRPTLDRVIADIVQTGLAEWWAPALAFAAGVVSFASPCVFPLVPGYLSFVSGAQEAGRRRLLPMLAFVGGFATVFSVLGASSIAVRKVFFSGWGQAVAGAIIALFGLFMLAYAFRLGPAAMYAERRPLLSRVRPGPVGAFPLGMAFAAGWTPCIGPVLAGIYGIAAAQGGGARGAFLLFVYSLGLGLPFLLVGLGVGRLVRALDAIKRNYHWIAGVSGVLMVTIGVLVATGLWTELIAPLLPIVGRFTPPI